VFEELPVPPGLQPESRTTRQVRAAEASQRRARFWRRVPRNRIQGIRAGTNKRRPRTGGKDPFEPTFAPTSKLSRAFVLIVSNTVSGLGPGIRVAGEKDAVQPLGNPVQLKEMEESNELNWGVNLRP